MTGKTGGYVAFTCAYTPLPLIEAAGFVPYRVLPVGDTTDRAGELLHDNMCPHVKRILDRAIAGDLPELAGMVVVDSCDTMQRLADALRAQLPDLRLAVLPLPATDGERSVRYLASELEVLSGTLAEWSGQAISDAAVQSSARRYNELAARLESAAKRGSRVAFQEVLNRSVTRPMDELLASLADEGDDAAFEPAGVPVIVFGNVIPDPEAFALFEDCGAAVVTDDLCTGSRQLTPVDLNGPEPTLTQLARSVLRRPACARTLRTSEPHRLADQIVERARSSGARGAIAHVTKFCDPYLARLPSIGRRLEDAGLPLLVLEGDCTTRSLGQHRTRIEAFVEMLEEV